MVRRDSSISLARAADESADGISVDESEPDETPLLQDSENDGEGLLDAEEQEDPNRPIVPRSVELSYRQLWKYSSQCCISLLLTLIPSFLVASWFTKVQTNFVMLPQILFYVRIISDFSSRLLTVYKSPASQNCLLYTSPSPRDLSTSRMPSSA